MDELPEEEKAGIPAWVVTFADLMSLLMCFFVLLLSFSEIDAQKFKQIAGELSKAFGVQREVPVLEIPMGTSPIFDKFSPAPPEPTVLNEVKQTTTEKQPELETLKSPTDVAVEAAIQEEIDNTLEQVQSVLEPAIKDGRVNVSLEQQRIVIRVEEKGAFPSGSADLTWEFEGLLLEMADILVEIPGKLTIEGHTDDIPIRTQRFYSNWDLSAARAAAVANALLAEGRLEPARLAVTGLAFTEPRVPNTSSENRTKNRRVEIIIDLSGPIEEQEMRLRELMNPEADVTTAPDSRSSGDSDQNELLW
ncbi:MotB family protein [Marinobacter sp.]|uniref:MotB family protein n=1 Tax=Marinobacter sp. TaxID=50741 RepID=UPI000C3CF2AA|nr:MotB family protein [Marinobacter sp.]MBE93739.1 type VI secretion system protein TssL [Marinobacter sp.]MBP55832.1 type VI secretion system protein TssL [Marinobacter sp.]|tara:strand:+ start:91 stop:1008 length:918 start_codon:yes stop_codon:yes gene_type:complete